MQTIIQIHFHAQMKLNYNNVRKQQKQHNNNTKGTTKNKKIP